MITLIIANEKMNDIMKIVKSLEESGVMIKGVSQTVKNEAKKLKGGFFGMLLPSGQVLVPRTSRGRPPPTSRRRLLKILLEYPRDVPN